MEVIKQNPDYTARIKEKALSIGFDLIGITRVRNLSENEAVLKKWCGSGMNGRMRYLSENTEKRANPLLVFPGAKSVIVSGMNYFTNNKQRQHDVPVISRYALGKDYEDVIKEKLKILLDYIKTLQKDAEGRIFVDSGPVLEKAWAMEAGLGWQGRHSILINKDFGSFLFLGILFVSLELDYDNPCNEEGCGACRLCINKCPVGAINDNRTIDARKCISYINIESKNPIPEDLIPELGGRLFGCDLCQEVCPWNKNVKPHKTAEFDISEELADMTKEEWRTISEEKYIRLFSESPVRRIRYDIIKRNIDLILADQSLKI
jgi:epoxyqueuosine reductase